MESRDLRGIFEEEHARLLGFDLDIKLMVVHDQQTGLYECLYNENSETSKDMVETIKKRLKERKEHGASA